VSFVVIIAAQATSRRSSSNGKLLSQQISSAHSAV
jgi:hypothetical protein